MIHNFYIVISLDLYQSLKKVWDIRTLFLLGYNRVMIPKAQVFRYNSHSLGVWLHTKLSKIKNGVFLHIKEA